MTEDKDPKKPDAEGSGRKVPSGFEKLLKRSKRGSTEKEEADAKKKEEDPQSEQEEAEGAKERHKEEKSDKKENEWSKNFRSQFFEPNGGGPKYENWALVACIGATGAFYVNSLQGQS